ncbi:MAG: HU family DNA-binding protein [Muribaculaceae bacterium]|nr:HU family DNA-binding protein [Muribaculaceae bacterium]MDE6135373.1 HU family DNA-binding protein [Muribaculaceae bacterium]
MDHKQFRRQICEATGRQEADVDALIEGLSIILRESAAELDSIAIPTFGTFVPEKHREEIVNDLSTGRRMLVPPEIILTFRPGAMLSKKITLRPEH